MEKNTCQTVMSLTQAARELGVAYCTVRELLKQGKLRRSDVIGPEPFVFVDAESVFALKRERELNPPKRGRKPKAATVD